ncbi:helix-turn-helix domain-containing protein [Cohnella nanjingensis]|uniref:Helix-turn-helix transcriptional regulator n=1 Tax=Cohnella nanjingensis TaxID=1387779 RepID=A0A7X0RN09_9BACL|nr:AraC family transcriptional regulator [Cohnella nanjingensis]MBB6670527.1 helix-turn-helix transcriptional regulator [Cohnella nanjingensis]
METIVDATNKGILRADAGMRRFSLTRYAPSADLAFFVKHYWVVRWDLRGQEPYRQVNLSFPNVNLSFERETSGTYSGVYGIPSASSSRLLQGEGTVLGVKFQPGGFYPYRKQPISQLTDTRIGFREAFGIEPDTLEKQICALDDGEQMAQVTDRFLRSRLPDRDPNVELATRIVQTVIDDRELVKVDDLARQFGLHVRTLQRLFHRYVGVSPKWVIQRFRLQEAAERMEQGDIPDWAKLTQDLGFYDQAHFIKCFKAMIGRSPEAYIEDVRQS